MTRSRINPKDRCPAVPQGDPRFADRRCTKRDGHSPTTPHSNEKSGYEITWTDEVCVHCGVSLRPVLANTTGHSHVTHLGRCQNEAVPYGHLAHPASEPCSTRADTPNPCLGSEEHPCTHQLGVPDE